MESGMCRLHLAARPCTCGCSYPRTGIHFAGTSAMADAIRRHPPDDARKTSAQMHSAANAELLDDALVAAFVGALEIVEKLAPLRHHLQQTAPRMIVLHVGL